MRVGEKVYYCHRIQESNSTIDRYEKAQEETIRFPNIFNPISFIVNAKNGYTDRLEYGETQTKGQRITLTPYEYWVGKFKIGDIFYLDGAKPSENEAYNGENANYYVEDVSNQNLMIELSLKKINEGE